MIYSIMLNLMFWFNTYGRDGMYSSVLHSVILLMKLVLVREHTLQSVMYILDLDKVQFNMWTNH